MLIRSQDKQKLLSLDNTILLVIDHDKYDQYVEGKEHFKIKAFYNPEYSTTLGVYSSENKSLAVLDEIAYNYERNKDAEYFGTSMGAHSCIFQMPDDNERWLEAKISKNGQCCEGQEDG